MQLTLKREALFNLANTITELGAAQEFPLPNAKGDDMHTAARLICSALQANTTGTCVLMVE